jgi:hypothetical protein
MLLAATDAFRKAVLIELKRARHDSVEHHELLTKVIQEVQLGRLAGLLVRS